MRSMAPMTLEDFAAAPFRVTASAQLDADPHAVFAELGDPSLWFALMRRSVWHTGATGGVGAEREVDLRAFGRFRERMLVWEPGARVTFTMVATTSPLIARLGEDYVLTRDGDGTRLDWTLAGTATTLGRPAVPVLRPTMRLLFARSVRALGKRAGSYPRARGTQTA